MGVYIPNEDMPEECYTCFCYETEFNMCSLTGKRLDNIRIRQDDCPLIEIVKCGECKWKDECILGSYGVSEQGFCYKGERKK